MTPPAAPETAQADATPPDATPPPAAPSGTSSGSPPGTVPEIGGRRDGTDPTRYGDWEKNGRCVDF